MNNISREQSEVPIALTLGLAAGGLLGKIIVNNAIKGQKTNNLTILQSEDTLTKVLTYTLTLMLGMLLNSSNPYNFSGSFLFMGFITVAAVTRYNRRVINNAVAIRDTIPNQVMRIPTLADRLNARVHGITPPSIGREFHLVNQKRFVR